MVITLDDECRDKLIRKKSQKRQAGADAYYRVVNAIREEYLTQDQATDLREFVEESLWRKGYSLSEDLGWGDAKLGGIIAHQPAIRRCSGDCHGNGGCDHDHHADPFAIVDRIVDQKVGHDCEKCSGGISDGITAANLAIGQFKIADKKGLITPNQLFVIVQWLKACYNVCHHTATRRDIMTGTVHNLDEYRKTHPRLKKDRRPKMFDSDSPVFPRLLAAIQSGGFLNHQAKELADKLLEKFGMKFLGLPVADRETMRDHAAKRRLKKIEPGEVTVIMALAEHELNFQQTQCAIRWLHALYEI